MIIDFHTHFFPDKIADRTLQFLSKVSDTRPHTDGTAAGLSASSRSAGIDLCVNQPVMTTPEQVDKVNQHLLDDRTHLNELGILTFAGMHPDYENYKAKLKDLSSDGFIGLKLHPAYQRVDLNDDRMLRIIDAASELDLIVLIHSGLDIGIPGHDFSDVSMILQVIDHVQPPKMVLAHMGGWAAWDQVKRDLAGAPVWLDTAFSIGKIDTIGEERSNLDDDSFVSLCRSHGTDRILFGTDSPWAEQKDYLDAIRRMSLTEDEKTAILGRNAEKLLGL